MSDEDDRTANGPHTQGVDAADEVLSAQLEAGLGCVGVPSGVVVVEHNPRLWDCGGEHVLVFQPLDMTPRIVLVLPCLSPVDVGA